MLFNSINNLKQRIVFQLLVLTVIFSFILTIGGCATTDTRNISSDKLPKRSDYEIVKAFMKDGSVIDLRNTQAKYFKEYKDQKNVIVYNISVKRALNDNTFAISNNVKTLSLNEVLSLTIEKEEVNTAIAFWAITGVALLVTVIVIFAKSWSGTNLACGQPGSCPIVYSYDGSKFVFDAEPYGGAIAEGLTKTDYNKLENLRASDGLYTLQMKNETDETQHTDRMSLLVIDHPENSTVTTDDMGNMTVYEKVFGPISALDEKRNDITSLIKGKDDIRWQTTFEQQGNNKSLKHELVIKFPRPKNSDRVKLLVNAGTGLWGGYMIKNMLDLYGNKIDDWYSSINNKGKEYYELYKFLNREELYSLNVNVLNNSRWERKGEILASSPMKFEDRLVDLDISNVAGDTLTLKLNPPCGFWEIDRIGVVYDAGEDFEMYEVPVMTAKDNNETDLTGLLNSKDNRYYDMPTLEDCAMIYFDVPQQKTGTCRTVYLKTTGYYDIHLKNKDKIAQTEILAKIWNDPGFVVQYSLHKYFEYTSSIGLLQK